MSGRARRTEPAVRLLSLLDIEQGASLHAESAALAARIVRELSEGMTQAERIATHEFLREVASALRWPATANPLSAPVALSPWRGFSTTG
jgi:hypothetical protein